MSKRRFKLVDGDDRVITIMANDGWGIVNTFPNPHPEPYFFALMSLREQDISRDPNDYNVENVKDHVYRNAELNQWNKKVASPITKRDEII